jgi:hypothetical protein
MDVASFIIIITSKSGQAIRSKRIPSVRPDADFLSNHFLSFSSPSASMVALVLDYPRRTADSILDTVGSLAPMALD